MGVANDFATEVVTYIDKCGDRFGGENSVFCAETQVMLTLMSYCEGGEMYIVFLVATQNLEEYIHSFSENMSFLRKFNLVSLYPQGLGTSCGRH